MEEKLKCEVCGALVTRKSASQNTDLKKMAMT